MAREYSKSASDNVRRVMKKRKAGTLTSGRSKKKVTSRKQAIAIALSESRRAGKKVPKKASRKAAKKTSAKKAPKTPTKRKPAKKTTKSRTAKRAATRKRTPASRT